MEKRLFISPDFFEELLDSSVTACVMSGGSSSGGGLPGGGPGKPSSGKSSTTPSPTPLGLDEDPFADD